MRNLNVPLGVPQGDYVEGRRNGRMSNMPEAYFSEKCQW
jgi:hypothetical protein